MIRSTGAGLAAIAALTLMAASAGGALAGAPATAEASGAKASPANPSNEVGEKFELPRVSGDNQIAMIAGLCGVQMKKMTPAACKCLATQAMTELSDPQRDYLIASVVAPPVADRMLKDRRVGVSDQKIIFTFLNTTSDACTSRTFVPRPKSDAETPAPAE